jgi:hypothetical protein
MSNQWIRNKNERILLTNFKDQSKDKNAAGLCDVEQEEKENSRNYRLEGIYREI